MRERKRTDCRKLGQRICVPRRWPVRYAYQRHGGRVGAAQIEIEHLASCRGEANCECFVATAMIALSGKFQFCQQEWAVAKVDREAAFRDQRMRLRQYPTARSRPRSSRRRHCRVWERIATRPFRPVPTKKRERPSALRSRRQLARNVRIPRVFAV